MVIRPAIDDETAAAVEEIAGTSEPFDDAVRRLLREHELVKSHLTEMKRERQQRQAELAEQRRKQQEVSATCDKCLQRMVDYVDAGRSERRMKLQKAVRKCGSGCSFLRSGWPEDELREAAEAELARRRRQRAAAAARGGREPVLTSLKKRFVGQK